MTTEIELKYQLLTNSKENNAIAGDITAMLEEEKFFFEVNQNQLTNDYFDTDDLALRKMDFGLRIRTKEKQYEQTIKTAGKVVGCLHQRAEYNVDITTNQLDLSLFPQGIWPENADVNQLEKALKVIFSTNFFRQTWLIHLGESVIELALDTGEIFTAPNEAKLTINELEIELVSGSEQALFDLSEKLKAVVTMEPGKLSKAARGYELHYNKNS